MSHTVAKNKDSGSGNLEGRKTSTYLFKWNEKANKVSVMIWEAGLQNQGRQVKLSRNDYWDGCSYQKLEELENHQDKVFYMFIVDGIWTVNPYCNQEEAWMPATTMKTMCNVVTHKELQSVAGLWHSVLFPPSTYTTPGPRNLPPLTGSLPSETWNTALSHNTARPELRLQGSIGSTVPIWKTVQEPISSDTSFTPTRGRVLHHRLPPGIFLGGQETILSVDEVLILDDRDKWWYIESPKSGKKALVQKEYIRIIGEALEIPSVSISEQSIRETIPDGSILSSPTLTQNGYDILPAVAEQIFSPSNMHSSHETKALEEHEKPEITQSNFAESIEYLARFLEHRGNDNPANLRMTELVNALRKDFEKTKAKEAHIICERSKLVGLMRQLQENVLGGTRLIKAPSNEVPPPIEDRKSYPYKRLDFDDYEIRLLKLSWDYSESSALRCSIEHVSLIDPGSYIALSYCWGDPTVTEKITLDDLEIDVTVSLASALKAVHKRYILTGNGIRVWADALCIDQGNNEERSHQVRSMRQIYSKASQVVCWVGPNEAPGFSKAVDFWGADDRRHSRGNDADDAEKLEALNSFERQSWMLLDQFFSQPYWQRVWIIQEITVASKATVFFGDFHMPWDVVARLLRTLQAESSLPGRPSTGAFINALHLLEFRYQFVNKGLGLMDALQMTQRALATDPRDKIFALLGLCHDGPFFVPIPNYKQPLETILADMTKAMMSMNRTLDPMCIRGTVSPQIDKPNLPTWSPDWVNAWAGSMTIQEADFFHWKRSYDFNPVLEGSNHRLIKVHGRFISKIARLSSNIDSNGGVKIPSVRQPWIAATSSLNQHNVRLRNPAQSELELRDFLLGTLTMSSSPIELTRSCFSTLWRPEGRGMIHNLALISWIDENAWFKVGPWTLREWSQVISKNIVRTDQPGIMQQIHRRVSWETDPRANVDDLLAFIGTLDKILGSGMKLAVLKGDQPLGMVHPRAIEEDEIYLLHGCTLPVVLRPKEDEDGRKQYHVIGAAYTLGTDPSSAYYLGTRDQADLLDWKGKDAQVLTLA